MNQLKTLTFYTIEKDAEKEDFSFSVKNVSSYDVFESGIVSIVLESGAKMVVKTYDYFGESYGEDLSEDLSE